ncbi:MAG: restriction endonuclease subunit S [Microcystaceae cyanobacterium]
MDRKQLPEGWEITTLGNLCNFVRGPFGGSLTKSCFKMSGYAVYEQQHAIYDQFENIRYFIDEAKYLEMKRFELFSGDLIMSCSGTMGKVSIVPDGILKGIINQALLKLSPKKDIVVEFLKYWMNSPNFQMQLNNLSQGVAIKNIASVKILKEIQILKPSVDEQKRIVAILDEAFEGIDQAIRNTEKNLANARELFDSYLNKIFTQKGDGWEEKKLQDICNVKDGTHDSPKYLADGIPFITQKNIRENGLTFENIKFISLDDHEKFYTRSNVAFGDILISMIGANRGMAAIVDDRRIFSIKNVGLIKANNNINKYFLLYFLKSNRAKNYVELESKGGAQPFIGLGKLREFPVIVAPQNKQDSIVIELDQLYLETQQLETIYRQKIAALNELKQSILQKAFTGQLTK